jgi:uncharacterized protein (TIGR02118 family)
MSMIVVTYPNSDGVLFDKEYYQSKHMELVKYRWSKYGLVGAEALFGVDGTQPFVAMAILQFKDVESMGSALNSPEAAEIMSDVANFTKISPSVFIATK